MLVAHTVERRNTLITRSANDCMPPMSSRREVEAVQLQFPALELAHQSALVRVEVLKQNSLPNDATW